MGIIRLLDKHVAEKIAAGEVVEKPISIVKELVENSIDAKATSIVVEIKKSGKTYIRVTDNGSGISKEDIPLAYIRHATSKVSTAEDLEGISTLGFRGEALASISAVSSTEIFSKTKESRMGYRVRVKGGELIEETGIGCPDGTTVIVKDLFYNTPVRLKFLKSDATESGMIIDFMTQIALAYPDIKVQLINNENTVFSTTGRGDRLETIIKLSNHDFGKKLVYIEDSFKLDLDKDEVLQMTGYISNIGESRSSRKGQMFFVNGRVVSSKILERAIDEAYREKLPKGRYPAVYLFLTIPPNLIDVNIHPNKREIRFFDDEKIVELLGKGIKDALQVKVAIPNVDNSNDVNNKGTVLFAHSSKLKIDEPKLREIEDLVKKPKEPLEKSHDIDEINNKLGENSIPTESKEALDRESSELNKNKYVKPKIELEEDIYDENKREQLDLTTLLNEAVKSSAQQVGENNRFSANSEENHSEIRLTATSDSGVSSQRKANETNSENQKLNSNQIINNHLEENNNYSLSNNQPANNDQYNKEGMESFDVKMNFESLEIVGRVFGTYLILAEEETMYMVDQHAAHERVNYEKMLAEFKKGNKNLQQIMVPIIITVLPSQYENSSIWVEILENFGYEIGDFGPNTFKISGIPSFLTLGEAELFARDFLDSQEDNIDLSDEVVLDKLAQKACKASIKANDSLKNEEIKSLLKQLTYCNNPFTCPHGRPTFLKYTKAQIEKGFRRI